MVKKYGCYRFFYKIKNFDLEVFLAFQRVVHASQAGK